MKKTATILELIAKAQLLGATVHTTSHEGGALATVQVLGLSRMAEWPLPAAQASVELGAALRTAGAV